MTDSPLAPVARDATHVLLFGGNSTTFFHSTSGALALIEILLSVVAERGGASVRQYLEMRQQRLQAERAYWDVPGREAMLPSASRPRHPGTQERP